MTDANDSTCLLETPGVANRDPRQWSRFLPQQPHSFVLLEGEQLAAEIVDESFDGAGVLVDCHFPIEVNEPIQWLHYGLPVRGIVRSITPKGRKMRLGIQWALRRRHTSGGRRRCRTESEYLLSAGLPVACRIVDQTGHKLIALLPDCTQLEVTPDDLWTISRFQRLADLKEAEDLLRLLTAVYQLGPLPAADDALRAVLNLEFAPSWD